MVPLDDSPGSVRALPIALRYAERLGASVDLISVENDPIRSDRQRERLSELARQCGEPVASCEVIVGEDHAEQIVRRCRSAPGSLIVMSDDGPSRTSGVMAESLAAELLADGMSIVIVGAHAAATAADLPIVACLDGSPEAEQVLPVAASWADQLRVSLVLVVVAPTPLDSIPDTLPAPAPGAFDPETILASAAEAVALDWPQLTVISRVVTYPWNIADALAIYLERHPTQLIAVATHIRDGWARLVHPSATARLVRQLAVPLLVVPIEPAVAPSATARSDRGASVRTSGDKLPFDHIIVPITPAHMTETAAVATARNLAALGAVVTFWTCNEDSADRDENDRKKKDLTQLVQPAKARWQTAESSSVVDGLLEFAAASPHSVICLNTDAPGRFVDTVMPTTTGQIIRWSPSVVVLTGPHCRAPRSAFSEIVGCIDGSLISEAVAEMTGAWAAAFGLPARLLEVVDPATRVPATRSIAGRYIDRLSARVARHHNIPVTGETIDDPRVASAIRRWADAHPDALLMMASHGTGLSEHVLGGVIMDVVRHASTPVVVVPAHSVGGRTQFAAGVESPSGVQSS